MVKYAIFRKKKECKDLASIISAGIVSVVDHGDYIILGRFETNTETLRKILEKRVSEEKKNLGKLVPERDRKNCR